MRFYQLRRLTFHSKVVHFAHKILSPTSKMLKLSTALPLAAALTLAPACHKVDQYPGTLYGIDKEEMTIASEVLAIAQAFEAVGEQCGVPTHVYEEGPLGNRMNHAKYRVVEEGNDVSRLWPVTVSNDRAKVAFAAEPFKPGSVLSWGSLGTPEFTPSYIVDFDWGVIDAAGEEGWQWDEGKNLAYDCIKAGTEELGCSSYRQIMGPLGDHSVWACDLEGQPEE